MIIPYMYPSITQLKAAAGSYKLTDAVSMQAEEERNGAVDLEMRYLYSGENADEIKCERLVMAVLQRNESEEPFRIYDIETPIDGVITVHAHHLSYDLDGATLEPFTATGITNVLSAINTQLGTLGFDFLLINDGLTFADEFGIDIPESAFSVLGKLLAATGAEVSYAWDKVNKRENVTLHASRGTVSTATIAYGFNLLRVDCSVNSDAVYSAIYPYYAKDEEGVLTLVTLPEKTIATGATTTRTRVLPVDLTSQFSDTPTQAELRQAANDYIGTVSWDAVTSCSVEFVPLQNTTEYEGNIDEQLLSLCDVVTVSADVIGVEMTSKVVKTVYDQLAEKYTEMTVGTIEQTIADTIAGLSRGSAGLSGGSGGGGADPATVPAQASIDAGGLISFKNAGGTTLFTLQLPVYGGA